VPLPRTRESVPDEGIRASAPDEGIRAEQGIAQLNGRAAVNMSITRSLSVSDARLCGIPGCRCIAPTPAIDDSNSVSEALTSQMGPPQASLGNMPDCDVEGNDQSSEVDEDREGDEDREDRKGNDQSSEVDEDREGDEDRDQSSEGDEDREDREGNDQSSEGDADPGSSAPEVPVRENKRARFASAGLASRLTITGGTVTGVYIFGPARAPRHLDAIAREEGLNLTPALYVELGKLIAGHMASRVCPRCECLCLVAEFDAEEVGRYYAGQRDPAPGVLHVLRAPLSVAARANFGVYI
jgi:hypothetical protein